MARYHVFYGAPTTKDLLTFPKYSYGWQTITPTQPPLTLCTSTLVAASRRISMLYENIIFRENSSDEQDASQLAYVAEDEGNTQPGEPETH